MVKNLRRTIFIIFSISLIIIFTSLGFWQLKRKIYKEELIELINKQIDLEEIEYSDSIKDKLYRHFKFSGHFDNTNKLFVYGSNNHNENNGYFILTPFLMDDGNNIMVVRGWTKNIDHKLKLEEKNNFSGIMVKSDKASYYTPNSDPNKRIFYSFDIKEIEKLLKIKLQNFIVVETSSTNLIKLNLNKFIYVYNRHIEYVFTWFTLAIFTFIMLVTNRKKL